MATTPEKPELVAIVGPTASGKSDLASWLARLTPAEIIAADSRTLYKGMDIGTAKPSNQELEELRYWGIDLLEPGSLYSAQQFQTFAKKKITEVISRQRLPLLVGGTGLYIDSVIYDFKFSQPASSSRTELELMPVEKLQALIKDKGWKLPENFKNKRHLIRTIEREGSLGQPQIKLRPRTMVIGIMPGDEQLRQNISRRADQIFKRGVLKETEALVEQCGREAVISTGGIVYKICLRVLDGEISEQTATTLFKTADWQYARRQKTWFKKNNDIVWFTDNKTALEHLKVVLNT
jgi:tRNA dimethylallyltransferase